MPDTRAASFSLLSWVRQGLAAGATPGDGRLSLPTRLRVAGGATREIEAPVLLYGPGDIAGLDPREVVRTEPVAMSTDVEPNYLPLIEFDRPDLPWNFSPTGPDTARRLHPWICLATIRKEALLSDLGVRPDAPLPVLHVPRGELPNPVEAWAWAHAQVSHSATEHDPGKLLRSDHWRSVSRLLSPRRLDAQTSYYVCLVPVYEIGRKAGLSEQITPDDERALRFAWAPDAPADEEVELPVYYHWEFRTGEREDFEALVMRLEPRPAPEELGLSPMDISEPGWTMPTLTPGTPGTVLGLEGSLRAPETASTPWPEEVRAPFQDRLRDILNAPADQATLDGAEAPVVAPPIYGQWYPRAPRVPEGDEQPRWLADLNLDPRYRVAAGMGASVVRFEQELLTAIAWEQLAEYEQDMWARRRDEFSREVGDALRERHFATLDTERLARVVEPLRVAKTPSYGEIHADGGVVETRTVESRSPQSATIADPRLSAAFRRLRSRYARIESDGLADKAIEHPVEVPTTVGRAARNDDTPEPDLHIPDRRKERLLATLGPTASTLPEPVERLGANGPRTAVDVEAREDAGAPIRFAPRFTAPMYEALRDYFPEVFLPGMELILPNTTTLLETNTRFIEAFMVGLNHEMSRELLWREYPVDRQGTFFRNFWDKRGVLVPGGEPPEDAGDISPIRDWPGSSRLGENTVGAAGEAGGRMVLLVRGDLMRRYPRALIYAVKAGWAADGSGRRELLKGPGDEVYPLFRATRAPDVALLGFRLTEQEVRGAPDSASGPAGYFFVIQEQPTELRFGLDEAVRYGEEAPESWSDLTWGHFAPSEEALKRLVYIPLMGALRDTRPGRAVPWGANGAHMAHITQQKPFRIAIHASAWV